MLFSLEALKAQHGDCLLLHWGDPARLILIDGGPGPVYRNSLEPRLEQLRGRRVGEGESLPVDMLVVSHIDRNKKMSSIHQDPSATRGQTRSKCCRSPR